MDWLIEQLKDQLVFSVVLSLVVFAAIMTAVAYCIYFERKISAWMQDRVGPNRVGPLGLLQPMADGAKFLLKEDIIPAFVDKPLFVLAPAFALIMGLAGFAILPWGGMVDLDGDGVVDVMCQVADPGVGLLYLLAVGGMAVYGVVVGGWANNNKFAFLAAMRATAQMLSYEIPMALVILLVVMTTGQLGLDDIARSQMGEGNLWHVCHHPVAFFIMLVTLFAETNRTPFDMAEAEQELIGGYHTEYSALKFGLFFLGEYAHMIIGSGFVIVLFLGGWHLPWVSFLQPEATSVWAMLAKMSVFATKIAAFLFLFMWVRWTLPRFRFDQLMRLSWKGLLPVCLMLFAYVTVLLYLGRQTDLMWTLGGNGVLILLVLIVAGTMGVPVSGRQGNLSTLPWEGAVRAR